MKSSILISLVAIAASVGGAVYQGKFCDRWENETSELLESFASRLKKVPAEFGDWSSVDVAVDPDQWKESNCNGVVSREYKNANGDSVSVFLVSGKAYHITIHTPDWCYAAAGYDMIGDYNNVEIDIPNMPERPDFLNAVFQKETATETTKLRILWSYSENGRWDAPKLAQHLYARKPALYKVYLISRINGSPPPLMEDPAVEFSKVFLPIVNRALFALDDPTGPAG